MAEVIFFFAAIVALAGALGTVVLRNPFYSVLALVCHLLGLAALFLLLRAEFVAAAQVIVYAGAVMVLYVFVVAYVGGAGPAAEPAPRPGHAGDRAAVRGRAAGGVRLRDPRLGPERARQRGHRLLPRLRLARGRSASCS